MFKGQSAIEYLTTYGWMLLVIAIVGGAIFTTVQNSSRVQSTSGLANADVQVEQFGVTSNGLETELRAASADQVENVNISLIDQDSGETVYSDKKATMPVGDTETVTFSNVGRSENTNTYDVEITYDTGGLEGLTAEGTITGRISINGSIPENNNGGSPETTENPPKASFTANPTSVNTGETIQFNASESTDNGSITKYEWDWTNDGTYEDTSGNKEPTKSYSTTGTKTVKLRVTDDQGNTDTTAKDIDVLSETNSAPTSIASANTTSVHPDEVIEFNGSDSSDSDGTINSYKWDWDEDSNYEGSGSIDTHNYSTTGTRNVELNVTDGDGASDTDTIQIEVTSNSAPNANFTANTTSVDTGEVFEVNASNSTDNDGTIESYEWDWTNDGTYEDTGTTATHSYGSTGTKTVKLRVTDDDGATNTTTKEIEVLASSFIETFEDGNLDSWSSTSAASISDSPAIDSSSVSIYDQPSDGGADISATPEVLSGGSKISKVTYYYQESSGVEMNGGGMTLQDTNGDFVLGTATSNPQWVIMTSTGGYDVKYDPGSYDVWMKVEISLDWQSDEYTATFTNLDSGTSKSYTQSMYNANPVNTISIGPWTQSNGDGWLTSGADQSWNVDNITIQK